MLVLDNARYQRKAYGMAEDEGLKVEILGLPTYSPNLNRIERVGKFVKAEGLHGRYDPQFAPFKWAIMDGFMESHRGHKTKLQTFVTLSFQPFKPAPEIVHGSPRGV